MTARVPEAIWTVMNPPPPIPLIHGSSTPTLNAAVTAASTALPPRSRTLSAASTAQRCLAATMQLPPEARSREIRSVVDVPIFDHKPYHPRVHEHREPT